VQLKHNYLQHISYNMSIIEKLTALYAPDNCLGCSLEGSLICTACRPTIPLSQGVCFDCHATISTASCSGCASKIGISSIAAATDYSGTARLLVACLKFRGNQSASKLMADVLSKRLSLPKDAVIVHVPATTAHVRQRGFDQARLIAKHLSRLSGLPCYDVLRRQGRQHQLGSERTIRQLQLFDAVTATKSATSIKHALLVDDVLTTGASLAASARALLTAGVTEITAVTFAQSIKKPD
jgi:ComF family protein